MPHNNKSERIVPNRPNKRLSHTKGQSTRPGPAPIKRYKRMASFFWLINRRMVLATMKTRAKSTNPPKRRATLTAVLNKLSRRSKDSLPNSTVSTIGLVLMRPDRFCKICGFRYCSRISSTKVRGRGFSSNPLSKSAPKNLEAGHRK